MDIWSLPELIRIEIFLKLDGESLHACRQVSHKWNKGILEELWGTQLGRRKLLDKLKSRWRFGNPQELETMKSFSFDVEDEASLVLLGMTDSVCVVRKTFKDQMKNDNLLRLTVVEENHHWEVSINSSQGEQGEMFYRAEITADLIVGVTDLGMVVIWSRISHQMLYCRACPVSPDFLLSFLSNVCVLCDQDTVLIWSYVTEEFIVLEHLENQIIEKCKVHHKSEETHILDFKMPFFLIECENGIQVWAIESDTSIALKNLIMLSRFGLEQGCLFYPFVALTVGHNVIDGWLDGWSLEIWNLESQQCIRKLPGGGYITDIKYCHNNLVLSRKVDEVPRVIIYDAQELASKSPDPWSRSFPVENIATKIFLNKTSIFLCDFDSCSVRLSRWNFWTS